MMMLVIEKKLVVIIWTNTTSGAAMSRFARVWALLRPLPRAPQGSRATPEAALPFCRAVNLIRLFRRRGAENSLPDPFLHHSVPPGVLLPQYGEGRRSSEISRDVCLHRRDVQGLVAAAQGRCGLAAGGDAHAGSDG